MVKKIKNNCDEEKKKIITKDNVTIAISITSLILSIISLIIDVRKHDDINIMADEKITFMIKDDVFRVGIPIVVYNNGNIDGMYYGLSMEIYNYNNPSQSYNLYFDRELEAIDASQSEFIASNTYHALFCPANGAEYYYLCFSMQNPNIFLAPGKYQIRLKGSNKSNEKKEIIHFFDMNFVESNYDLMMKYKTVTIRYEGLPESIVDLTGKLKN